MTKWRLFLYGLRNKNTHRTQAGQKRGERSSKNASKNSFSFSFVPDIQAMCVCVCMGRERTKIPPTHSNIDSFKLWRARESCEKGQKVCRQVVAFMWRVIAVNWKEILGNKMRKNQREITTFFKFNCSNFPLDGAVFSVMKSVDLNIKWPLSSVEVFIQLIQCLQNESRWAFTTWNAIYLQLNMHGAWNLLNNEEYLFALQWLKSASCLEFDSFWRVVWYTSSQIRWRAAWEIFDSTAKKGVPSERLARWTSRFDIFSSCKSLGY
jgi:hypothetical protein